MSGRSGFSTAADYPHVHPSMFVTNSIVDLAAGTFSICEHAIRVSVSPFSKSVDGGLIDTPSYDLQIGNTGLSFEDRIAVIGIGSNSSPDILLKKLSGKAGGQIVIIQAELDNHVVVYGAFIGKAGSIPATVMPDGGSTTQATIAFLTPEQFGILTTTEPNYDVVQTGFVPILKQGMGMPLEQGAAVYISPWGALTTNGVTPIALETIPSITDLPKMSSLEVMQRVASILQKSDVKKFFNALPKLPVEKRLNEIFKLQVRNALPARIQGRPIFRATIGEDCAAIGRRFPSIRYLY